MQIFETDFRLKKIYRKPVQSQREKQFGRFENKSDNVWIANFSQIFAVKLIANYGSCFHCYIIFWTCRTFYISLEVFYYNWPQSKAVNNVLTSCINNVIFTLISNELIKVADLRKSPNQLMLNGALVIEMVNNSFKESKKKIGHLIKWGTF